MEGQMPNDTIAMNGWVGGMQTSPLNFDYNIYSESMDSSSFMGDNLKKTPDAMKGIDPALYNNQWSAEFLSMPQNINTMQEPLGAEDKLCDTVSDYTYGSAPSGLPTMTNTELYATQPWETLTDIHNYPTMIDTSGGGVVYQHTLQGHPASFIRSPFSFPQGKLNSKMASYQERVSVSVRNPGNGEIEYNIHGSTRTVVPSSLHHNIMDECGYMTEDSACSPPDLNDGQNWFANNHPNSHALQGSISPSMSPTLRATQAGAFGYNTNEYTRRQTRSHTKRKMEDDEPSFQRSGNGTETPERQAENRLLIALREKNTPYKTIVQELGNKYTESTLRGRWRTLSKKRQDRVRKPKWLPHDVKLLKMEVEKTNPPSKNNGTTIGGPPVKWKMVTESIKQKGASYKFGVTTAKKKYEEVLAKGLEAVMRECELAADSKPAKK